MACKYVAIPKEDTYELIERARNGDSLAKESLVTMNTGLVKNIALKFICGGYELDDLVQIGFIGLLKAIDRFDTNFDVMFSTYAVPMILGEIKRYIRDDGPIKVSRQLKQEIKAMRYASEEYYRQKGEYPKVSELAEVMEITNDRLMEIMEAADALASIDSLDNDEKPAWAAEQSADSYADEELRRIDVIHLKTLLRVLEEKERQVIVLRYFQDMTQQQIAERLGISQVQVSRIEKRVILKLRKEMIQ